MLRQEFSGIVVAYLPQHVTRNTFFLSYLTKQDETGHDKAVRVLFFAQLKDATKCDSVEIAFSSSVTADELWIELLKKFPALAGHRSSVRLARNFEYTPGAARFSNADEVALIPPVSGG